MLLKEILEAAAAWRPVPTNPAKPVRKAAVPHREATLWSTAEIQRFLLAADDTWRPLFLAALLTWRRLGELRAMAWNSQNRPNFATNEIEAACPYNDRTPIQFRVSGRRCLRYGNQQPARRCSLGSGAIKDGDPAGMNPNGTPSPRRRAR